MKKTTKNVGRGEQNHGGESRVVKKPQFMLAYENARGSHPETLLQAICTCRWGFCAYLLQTDACDLHRGG